MSTPLSKRLLLATLTPLVMLGLIEAGFRVAGFEYAPSPMSLMVNQADPVSKATQADDDLFWTLIPSTTLPFHDLKVTTNELGTRDALPPRKKTPGTLRIVCLGDSTAFGGYTTYPMQLSAILRDCVGDRKVEVINGGVPGWTSFQGMLLLQRDLVKWRPDIVTTSFGYNNSKQEIDGLTDRVRAGIAGAFAARIARVAKKLRCVQFVAKKLADRKAKRDDFAPGRTELPMRCAPDEYARCLDEIKKTCDEIGAKVVFMSQPHAFRWKEGDPKPAIPPARILETATRLDAQNAAAAAEAARLGVPFVDLAAKLATLPAVEVFSNALPGTDPLHTSALGARVVAETIAGYLVESKLVPGGSPAAIAPHALAGTAASVAIDSDRDGADELLLASVVDGALSLRVLDPRTGVCRPIAATLPVPDAGFELAQIPLLHDELLLFVPRQGADGTYTFSRKLSAEAGSVTTTTLPLPRDAQLQVQPLDLEGDGTTEYGVAITGLAGRPAYSFFDANAKLIGIGSLKRPNYTSGIRLAAIPSATDTSNSLYLTPCAGEALVARAEPNGRLDVQLTPRWLRRAGSTDIVAGRFFDDGRDVDLLLVQPTLVIAWDKDVGLGPAFFPVGSAAFDIKAPRPVLANIKVDGSRRTILGVRSHGRIHLFECDGRSAREWQSFADTGSPDPR